MEPFLGQIMMFAGNFAPQGWAFCNGQLLSIAQNTALFSLLGTTYGGNGTTTFALPNLQGRAPMHHGQGAGLSPRSLGEQGGTESVTLTSTQLPAHSHTLALAAKEEGTTDNPNGAYIAGNGTNAFAATSDTTMAGTNVSITGNGQPFPIMQPFLAVSFVIALQGIYPSRG